MNADFVLLNARIATMDAAGTEAQALAALGGRIVALGSREAVTPMQALAAYTTLGAWAQREEAEKGSLEIGKLADLAVLDTDILACDPATIRDARVVAMAVGGVRRHGG